MQKKTELRVLRAKFGLTQAGMADKLGINRSTYSLIESGKRNGSSEFWIKLQRAFGYSDTEIMELIKCEIAESTKQ